MINFAVVSRARAAINIRLYAESFTKKKKKKNVSPTFYSFRSGLQ